MAQQTLSEAFRLLNRSTRWEEVVVVPVDFDTFHPQGFALVDSFLFVSSVEVITPTRRFAQSEQGMDRSQGNGKGHLFKMDLQGKLLAHIEIGEGAIYHPGGMAFDGKSLWVPVAEYRPHSRSIVYQIDVATLNAREVFRYPDHIGGILHNVDKNTLHGVSWGSRRFYAWTLNDSLEVTNADVPPAQLYTLNPSHYIDYQDCMYADNNLAVCTGLSTYHHNQTRFALGGIELVDLNSGSPVHQVPFQYWTEKGLPLTQNPVTLELQGSTLRLYAMPEDNKSRLFIYETEIDAEH